MLAVNNLRINLRTFTIMKLFNFYASSFFLKLKTCKCACLLTWYNYWRNSRRQELGHLIGLASVAAFNRKA